MVSNSNDEKRIAALEEALLEYVGLYGLSELAKRAFQSDTFDQPRVANHQLVESPSDLNKHRGFK